ncbi:MAG: transposase [Candidatus Thorarchaeota archaeon]|nr:transposase [Candidatus Thorarchaeota archaeon]
MLAIDLGIRKSVYSVLLTPDGLKQVRYWTQKDKLRRMEECDRRVASLQRERHERQNNGLDADGVLKKLREMSTQRANISFDHDRKMVSDMAEYVLWLARNRDVRVAVGLLRGIRSRARRGNGKGPGYRGMIHRWSFARVTRMLIHKLSMLGFEPGRVYMVNEAWTSIKCHKCGNTGLRPRQSFFLCHTCGYRDNADKNAAVNIGRRLIRLIPSLRDERGLGMWLFPHEKSTPKARRSTRSEGRSSASERSPASSAGGGVADFHVQVPLEVPEDSTDPAMQRTMGNPSVAAITGSRGRQQRTEVTSGERASVPMTTDKPHAQPAGEVLLVAGDSSHEED